MLARRISRAVAPLGRALSTAPAEVIVLEYEDVVNPSKDLSAEIEVAYGYEGLGILAVRNIPGYAEARSQLLPLARALANLPSEELAELEHEASFYSRGWSHGREKFMGEPDLAKGSFYANPLMDEVEVEDQSLLAKYPSFLTPNLWPSSSLPQLEGAFKGMGQLLIGVGAELARHCDTFAASNCDTYPARMLERTIRESRVAAGRLLYYFPMQDSEKERIKSGDGDVDREASDWCGWHNDHGSLTGLANAMFFDDQGREIPCPDPSAGLYARSRTGEIAHVVLPPNCAGFQIGESAQIMSGGELIATPHSVRSADVPGVSRATFAVFMEPEWHQSLQPPPGVTEAQVVRGVTLRDLPPGVVPIEGRWNATMDFGQFNDATLATYY